MVRSWWMLRSAPLASAPVLQAHPRACAACDHTQGRPFLGNASVACSPPVQMSPWALNNGLESLLTPSSLQGRDLHNRCRHGHLLLVNNLCALLSIHIICPSWSSVMLDIPCRHCGGPHLAVLQCPVVPPALAKCRYTAWLALVYTYVRQAVRLRQRGQLRPLTKQLDNVSSPSQLLHLAPVAWPQHTTHMHMHGCMPMPIDICSALGTATVQLQAGGRQDPAGLVHLRQRT